MTATTDGAPAGVDLPRVTEWLTAEIAGVEAPITVSFLSGGRSNLTFLVTDASGQQLVLRRPPLGHVLSTAHDMAREHRIISALADTDVPVAPARGFCADPDVNGAPFYVMDYVAGPILDTVPKALAYPEGDRRPAAATMIDVMSRLHRIEPDDVGLGTLGRREGYIERQLRRWKAQLAQSNSPHVAVLDEVHDRLATAIPPQRWTGIVHGDFRLGNMILGPGGELRAVLDWELATLGDTLADLAWLVTSWIDPGETPPTPVPAPTSVAGFPTRAEIVAWYGQRTGRDLSDLPYYLAFNFWRSACIGAGVLARYQANVMGADDFDIEEQTASMAIRAEQARASLDGDWTI